MHKSKYKIAIVGAGNGGQAMAGHFAMMGHEIYLYNRSVERIMHIQRHKQISLEEAINGTGTLQLVTNNLEEAIRYADLIMVTTTADAHRELAEKIAPYVREDQLIVLNPGRTLGAFEFGQVIRQKGKKQPIIAEAQSLIYACRIEQPGLIRVVGVKDKVLFAAYPSVNTDYAIDIVNSVFNCFIKVDNVLVTGLENFGAIFHPAVVMFNAAAIERGQGFYFYNDMTPTIANFLEQLDKERLLLGEAFGIPLRPAAEWVSFAYENIQGSNLCERMRNNPAYYKILAPTSLHSRLLFEDVPTGILPFIELARMAGIRVPLMESIYHIAQALLNVDFRFTGRTLRNLGIENMSAEAFIKEL